MYVHRDVRCDDVYHFARVKTLVGCTGYVDPPHARILLKATSERDATPKPKRLLIGLKCLRWIECVRVRVGEGVNGPA